MPRMTWHAYLSLLTWLLLWDHRCLCVAPSSPHQALQHSKLAPSCLQRRCAEAEARQQEAAARIPEATQPLMRQLEAMQVAGVITLW